VLKKSWNLFLFLSFELEPWQIFIVQVGTAEKVFKVRDQWVITLTLSWRHMTYKPNKLHQIDLVFGLWSEFFRRCCNWPWFPAVWFRSDSSDMVSANHFCKSWCSCHANMHKWGLAKSSICDCGQQQTMNHIIDTRSWTKFEGRLPVFREAEDM